MKGLLVTVSVLLAAQSAYGLGLSGLFGGGGCGCGAPAAPPPCAPAPAPACPAAPACPTAVCPPQPIYEACPVCPPIPVYEVPACPPCPAPPQTICIAQQIPAPQPVAQPAQSSCCARDPCSRPCRRAFGAVIHTVGGTDEDPTCNSQALKIILHKFIAVDTETSKHAIHKATLALKGKHDVICANSDFSYIVNSDSFCQLTKDNITCYVFKQA